MTLEGTRPITLVGSSDLILKKEEDALTTHHEIVMRKRLPRMMEKVIDIRVSSNYYYTSSTLNPMGACRTMITTKFVKYTLRSLILSCKPFSRRDAQMIAGDKNSLFQFLAAPPMPQYSVNVY